MPMEKKNEIVVYQPNETIRLDVRLENETVWLTQAQMCALFQRDVSVISRHIRNIFAEGELDQQSNLHFLQIAHSDRPVTLYSLDVSISVGYRVKSAVGTRFRQWANKVIKDYLLRGYSVNARLNQLEDRTDRRFAQHDRDIAELKGKVDFFVQTQTPPLQGVFYDGQLWDARAFAERFSEKFHDRFLILDDEELYLIGASLKDLGRKCFAFTKLDAAEIAGLKARI